jgi:exportin-5
MNFEDPMIRRRVIQLMVTVSTSALHKKADLMLKILEHVCPFFLFFFFFISHD